MCIVAGNGVHLPRLHLHLSALPNRTALARHGGTFEGVTSEITPTQNRKLNDVRVYVWLQFFHKGQMFAALEQNPDQLISHALSLKISSKKLRK